MSQVHKTEEILALLKVNNQNSRAFQGLYFQGQPTLVWTSISKDPQYQPLNCSKMYKKLAKNYVPNFPGHVLIPI